MVCHMSHCLKSYGLSLSLILIICLLLHTHTCALAHRTHHPKQLQVEYGVNMLDGVNMLEGVKFSMGVI